MSSATVMDRAEVAALRGKIMQLELKHRIQRMGQSQRMEKKDLEQKMELMKMQAALDRNEQRTEKKDLEQKMELSIMEIKMQAVLEKKDLEQKMQKNEQKMELMKMQAALDKKDHERDREADKKEAHHQIDQLRWEARLGKMEQQLHAAYLAYTIQPLTHPAQFPAHANLTQQRGSEELVPQRIQLRQLERREKEAGPPQSIPAAAVQYAAQHSTAASILLPSAARSSAPMRSTEAVVAQPSAMRPVKASVPQQEQHQPTAAQSANVQQQQRQQVAAGPAAARAVSLPGNARTHFFLSHCQATGGDQTNAIYLELEKLGFSCWYKPLESARAISASAHTSFPQVRQQGD
jgi:hypothetical protein